MAEDESAPTAEDSALSEYEAAQAKEWNTYVARWPIYIDGALAFKAEDPVPVSHVVRGVVAISDVRRTDEPAPVTEPEIVTPPPGAEDEASPEEIEAAEAANREAGVIE